MPGHSPAVVKTRLAILTLLLEARRALQNGAEKGAIPFETGYCALAVRHGEYSGKPLDVSGVAQMTGLPVATADRHLKTLQKLGRVRAVKIGRRSVQYLALGPEHAAVEPAFQRLEKLILKAATNIANAK